MNKTQKMGVIAASMIVLAIISAAWFRAESSTDTQPASKHAVGQGAGDPAYESDAGGSNSRSDASSASGPGSIPTYDFSEASDHIGEKATVTGTVVRAFTSKNGVTFLDYCPGVGSCPFSAVIFASDAAAFGDMTKYQGQISVTGVIKSYQGAAEMVLDSPDQVRMGD